MNEIQINDTARHWLMPEQPTKDEKSQLGAYIKFLEGSNIAWGSPNLAVYRDHLREKGLATTTIRAYLSNIRSQYKALLRSQKFKSFLWSQVEGDTPSDRKAYYDRILGHIQDGINSKNAQVKSVQIMDEGDEFRTRLTEEQILELLKQPYRLYGNDDIRVERDVAMIATWVGMGLRRFELQHLQVKDLDQMFEGNLCMEVCEGKDKKQRMIPYGANVWILKPIRKWLDVAGITEGYIFRGMYKGGKVRPSKLTVSGLDMILRQFTIKIDDKLTQVVGHDLRATYARIMWEKGMPVEAIARNMGHTHKDGTPNTAMTWRYIGDVGVENRVPKVGIQVPDFI